MNTIRLTASEVTPAVAGDATPFVVIGIVLVGLGLAFWWGEKQFK